MCIYLLTSWSILACNNSTSLNMALASSARYTTVMWRDTKKIGSEHYRVSFTYPCRSPAVRHPIHCQKDLHIDYPSMPPKAKRSESRQRQSVQNGDVKYCASPRNMTSLYHCISKSFYSFQTSSRGLWLQEIK